jgi:hypothetical protein
MNTITKIPEQKYLDLGRIAFIVKSQPREGELDRLGAIINKIDIYSVEYFLFKKGYFYEMGRRDRLNGKNEGVFTVDSIREIPRSWPAQSDESLINEIQIMYDLGWDNPDKYDGTTFYLMTKTVLDNLEKDFN